MLGETGEVRRVAALATVFPDTDEPGAWVVGALDASGDGGMYFTVFAGPDAEERAIEYAEAKYAGLERRTQAR